MLLALIAGAAAIPSPSQLHRWWTTCAQTHPVACIRYAAAKYDQPFEEMRTVAWRESRLDPTVTSTAGCQGLYQFASSTWAGITINGHYFADPYRTTHRISRALGCARPRPGPGARRAAALVDVAVIAVNPPPPAAYLSPRAPSGKKRMREFRFPKSQFGRGFHPARVCARPYNGRRSGFKGV